MAYHRNRLTPIADETYINASILLPEYHVE
ncbi:hypothetical protein EV131_13422 [Rhizobium laguerreae]|uniref:Uncharacterized protein n=1 Tax=Rhizobium laguerreae TaxID=1076926 RepID=A0AAX2Q9P3_9HYPH|nr:hypothetical protein EV131_13422 [Rhizobium laguerreae]